MGLDGDIDARKLRLAAWLADVKGDARRWYVPHSKQQAFHAAGAGARERLFLAGNRVGKTLAGACEMAFHLTGNYPDWWDGLRYDRAIEAWAASVTRETTRDILQAVYVGPKGVIPKRLIAGMSMKSGVAGAVDTVRVRHASGGVSMLGFKSYVTRALPLTAEQQAQKSQLDAILAESLGEIQKVSSADYAPDDATKAVLDRWTAAQNDLLKAQVTTRSQTEEEALARRGMSDSTAAQDVRRQRLLDQQKAEQNIGLMADEMGQQVRNDKLSLQQNLYNLASTQTDVSAARTAQAAARAQSSALALNAQRQASIMDYYGGGSSVFGNAFGQSIGSSIGNQTGGMFGTVGNMLGSLFSK